MKYLNTPHEKKSAVITTVIAILLILLFFLLGLKYYDPPITFGMEVNLGTTARGNGKTPPPKAEFTNSTPQPAPKKSPTKVLTKKNTAPETVTEEQSDVAVPPEEPKKNPPPTKKVIEKVTPPKPKVDESTKNILSNLVNQKQLQEKETYQGEGDDRVAGDKGKIEGNPYAITYFNLARAGGMEKGFGLNGRQLESRGKVVQECNQEGVVVVRITVDRKGDVIQAEPGVKGSTNTHPCLLKPAKETALLHKWYSDTKAPALQVGFVVIQFKLGE